jgi:serine/threonine protein phosphatase PrpC
MELQQELQQMSMLVPYAAQIIPRTRRAGANSFIYCYERGSEIQLNQDASATTVYALIETLGDPQASDTISQLITSQLDHLFPIPGSEQPVLSFEATISHVNKALAKHGAKPSINAAIVHIAENKVSVVHTGKAEAHMNRGRSFIRITEEMPQQVQGKTQSTFSEVADGVLKSGDKLLLATPGLLHHISVDQIKNSIMDNTPAASAQKLARLVDNRPDSHRAAAVIIEIAAPEYLAEFASGGSTTVIDISSKESLGDVAKATTVPIIRKTGRQIVVLATRFGHWTVSVAVPTTKKLTVRSVDGIKSTYKKIAKK